MKTLLSLITSLALGAGAFAADPVNAKCPLSGKDIDTAQTAEYKKEISFCCDKCKGKFDKDPDSFVAKIASYDAKSGKCILSGKDIDAAQKSTYTKTVAFCCDKCKGKFEKEPDKSIAKAVKK
jgi:YHS domain-containing protein